MTALDPATLPRLAAPAASNRGALTLVLAASGALLAGAFAFQHLGGLSPCEMCVWQRWAHVAALGLGLIAWALGAPRALVALAALGTLVSGAIGGFHAGVEQGWWEGVTACSAGATGGSTADIIGSVLATPLVRCDAIPWALAGISMAGWNAILSLGVGGTALWLLRR